LAARANCWEEDHGNYRRAGEAWAWACCLDRKNIIYEDTLKRCLNRWGEKLLARQPPNFPAVILHGHGRRFPDLPLELEQGYDGWMVRENALDNASWNERYWEPMRRGRWPAAWPNEIKAYINEKGECVMDLRATRLAAGVTRPQFVSF
jgi:hypothetical protein